MNYKDLQYKYSKPKKHKKLTNEDYKLTKGNFSASTWKDYKEWVKEQKLKESLQKRVKKKKKKTTKKPVDRKTEYKKELKNKRWNELRLIVMKRDEFKCKLCGSKHNLNVHHIKYKDGKKAWEYPITSLITLCEECHKKVHSDINNDLNPYNKNNFN